MHRDGRVRIGGTATMITKDGFCSDSEIYNVNAFRVRRAMISVQPSVGLYFTSLASVFGH